MKRFFMTAGCLGICLVLFALPALSKEDVEMTVVHPGEINVSKYTTIAIGNIDGNLGEKFGDLLRELLVDAGYVKVIDRNRLNTILQEQGISQSDLMAESSRLKLGKILTASALINGHYDGDYKESLTSERVDGHREYTRKGRATTQGNIEITDLVTGQILKSINLDNSSDEKDNSLLGSLLSGFTSDDTETSTDEEPAPIDQAKLMGKCLYSDLGLVYHTISPWKQKVKVSFEEDKALPGLEKGIAMVKMGNLDLAETEFANMVKAGTGNKKVKGKVLAKAHWNLGLVCMYTGKFEKATECFTTAYTLDSDKKYIQANDNLKELQKERKALIEYGILKEEK